MQKTFQNKLPYLTTQHEFFISWSKDKAFINCQAESESEAIENPIKYEEFKTMIETASIKGVSSIFYSINYSTEVHTKQIKYLSEKYKVKINRHQSI
jgi:hypothetical protein